jgi:uncharacterized repeat protein (TIGR01451 family)
LPVTLASFSPLYEQGNFVFHGMKMFLRVWKIFLLAIGLAFIGRHAEAQAYFGLSVVPSANSLLVSNSLTYTITVTNNVGDLGDAVISNTLPASVQLVSATPNIGGSVTNNGSIVVFNTGGFSVYTVAQMSLTVQPTAAGFITNQVIVLVPSTIVTNTAATNVVTQVTNVPPVMADLGVTIAVPTTAIISNDWVTYAVTVTNAGPSAAPGVMLTNVLPAGVILNGVLPKLPLYSLVGSNMIFNLGTLNSGAFTSFQFSIQPTNAGLLNCSASADAPNILDPNPTNNSAASIIPVYNYLPGYLLAVTNSAQIVNQQNGLIEQSILLSNLGTNSVTAARVVVTGLNNRLFNAVGTNSGSPFVVYTAPSANPLATNSSVSLLLQYSPRLAFAFANSQLQAFVVPVPNLAPPTVSSASRSLNITHILPIPNGDVILAFPSTLNRTYTIVYSDNASFSNAMIAPPAIVAPANQVQWIDYGPPTTVSVPSAASARFYRVIQN